MRSWAPRVAKTAGARGSPGVPPLDLRSLRSLRPPHVVLLPELRLLPPLRRGDLQRLSRRSLAPGSRRLLVPGALGSAKWGQSHTGGGCVDDVFLNLEQGICEKENPPCWGSAAILRHTNLVTLSMCEVLLTLRCTCEFYVQFLWATALDDLARIESDNWKQEPSL